VVAARRLGGGARRLRTASMRVSSAGARLGVCGGTHARATRRGSLRRRWALVHDMRARALHRGSTRETDGTRARAPRPATARAERSRIADEPRDVLVARVADGEPEADGHRRSRARPARSRAAPLPPAGVRVRPPRAGGRSRASCSTSRPTRSSVSGVVAAALRACVHSSSTARTSCAPAGRTVTSPGAIERRYAGSENAGGRPPGALRTRPTTATNLLDLH
jgi:hypothetical protein